MSVEPPMHPIDNLLIRLRALSKRLHARNDDGSKNVGWHPEGFAVDEAIEEIERLRALVEKPDAGT